MRVLFVVTYRSSGVTIAQTVGLILVLAVLYLTWRGSRTAWVIALVAVVGLPLLGLLGRDFDAVAMGVVVAAVIQVVLLTSGSVRSHLGSANHSTAPSPSGRQESGPWL